MSTGATTCEKFSKSQEIQGHSDLRMSDWKAKVSEVPKVPEAGTPGMTLASAAEPCPQPRRRAGEAALGPQSVLL